MKKEYIDLKTKEGAHLFSVLAQSDPDSALTFLMRTIGKWTKGDLLKFTTGRREVVFALERMAMWKDLFTDAARLLLALGEAENETWGNNASGVFAELFSPGYGKVASTEASPQERFPVLKEALESNSKERRKLALQACKQALETQHFTRMVGAEYQGLRKPPQLWTPKTYGELFDAYRQVWQFLLEKLDVLPEEEQQEVVSIILNCSRGVGRIQNLAYMVVETVKELLTKPYVNTKDILQMIISFLHYEGKELPTDIRQLWEHLKDELTGSDFHSLMRRYVGMDVFEDKFDENGKQVDQAQPEIEKLAEQSINNNELLKQELNWLVTTKAENGFRFGYELGKRDMNFSLFPMLLEAQRNASRNASVYFLGGYCRVISERSPQEWERQLDIISEDKKLNIWVSELSWRTVMSDRSALRILDLATKGMVSIEQFRMFGYGRVIRNLSEKIFQKWIEFLLSKDNFDAVSIALDLYRFYYLQRDAKINLPKELTLRILIHPLLFKNIGDKKRSQMDEHNWTEVGKAFVLRYAEKNLVLVDKILEHFGEDNTIFDSFHSPTQSVLDEVVRQHPKETWLRVAKYIGPPLDTRAFHIREWLKGSSYFDMRTEAALPLFPIGEIWKWVDEDIENRAWYLASFIPKGLFLEEGRICFAREMLVKYGDREDVRRELIANFWSGGWSGPASLHYQKKKDEMLKFKENENNENVKRWIDEYVSGLDKDIETSKIEEERRGF